MRTLAVLALVLAAAPLAWLAAPAPAAPSAPALGPGSVIGMHRELLAAIDAGDGAAAAGFVAGKGLIATQGENGPVIFTALGERASGVARGADACKKLLADLAERSRDGGPAWSTRITESWADCASEDLSYAVLQFERTRGVKGGLERYRSTSLVRHEREGWKLMHWNLARVDGEVKLGAGEGSAR